MFIDLIRRLGANKTENAIVTVSKAAPVIQGIVDNFDRMGMCEKEDMSSEEII